MSRAIPETEPVLFDLLIHLGENGKGEVFEIVAALHDTVNKDNEERLVGLHGLRAFCDAVGRKTSNPRVATFANAIAGITEFFAGLDHEAKREDGKEHFLEAVKRSMETVTASLKRGDGKEIEAYTSLFQGAIHLAIPRLPMDIQPGLFLQASDRLGKAIPLVSPRQVDSLRASLEFCKNPRGLN